MNGIQDFSLCHHFTAAYNISVSRLLFNQLIALLHGELLRIQHTFSCSYKVRIFFQIQDSLYNICHHTANRRTAGQPRRFDACTVNKTRSLFELFNNKLMSVFVGSKSCKRGNHLTKGNIFHCFRTLGNYFVKSCSGCIGSFLILNINRCRTHNQISVYSRRYQNAFSIFSRQGKNGMIYMLSCRLIQQTVVSPSWCNRKLPVTDHIVNLICINACCIHHTSCFKIALIGMNQESVFFLFDSFHLSVKLKFHTIGTGIFCHSDIQIKRTYNTAGGCIKSCYCLIRNIRLHFHQLIPLNNPETFYSVFDAPLQKHLQPRTVFFLCADNQRTRLHKLKIQILCQLSHHFVSLNIQLSHQRTACSIVSCMDNSAVCL